MNLSEQNKIALISVKFFRYRLIANIRAEKALLLRGARQVGFHNNNFHFSLQDNILSIPLYLIHELPRLLDESTF